MKLLPFLALLFAPLASCGGPPTPAGDFAGEWSLERELSLGRLAQRLEASGSAEEQVTSQVERARRELERVAGQGEFVIQIEDGGDAAYALALRSGGGTLQKREQGAWRTSEQGLLIELSEGPALSARLVGGELLLRSERSAGSELEWVLQPL